MPVYNTGEQVITAIKSVQQQTDTDWELIIVNDASPDNAATVLKNYLENSPDARVRVFTHETNRGVSAARNTALDKVRGKWVAFLDSDDSYEPEFLSTLHSAAASTNAEIALGAHKLIALDNSEIIRQRVASDTMPAEEAAIMLLADKLTPYLWDKIFAVHSVKNLRFNPQIKRAEDALFVFQALLNSKTFTAVSAANYRYMVGTDGLTWGRITPIAESDLLVCEFTQTAANLTHKSALSALAVAKILTYLNNSQQALIIGTAAKASLAQKAAQQLSANAASSIALKEARETLELATTTIAACSARIHFKDIILAAKTQPLFAAAAALLKLSPAAYKALYSAYAKKRYGI